LLNRFWLRNRSIYAPGRAAGHNQRTEEREKGPAKPQEP